MENPDLCDSGRVQNDLLRQFHRGYPVENLRSLLSHRDDKIVKAAVFVASELGSKASPLVREVARLLRHSAMVVRYNAIDSLLTCTKDTDEGEIAAVVSLLDDPEGAVRKKVMDFLARASEIQLQAALRWFGRDSPSSVHSIGLRGLISNSKWDMHEAMSVMKRDDVVLRKYGAVAIARMDLQNSDSLPFASATDDEDVRCFLNNVLELRTMGENQKKGRES
jgi:hypothetical protein